MANDVATSATWLSTLKLEAIGARSAFDFERSLELFKQRHALVEQRYPPDSELALFSLVDMATSHQLVGNHREARAAAEEASRRYSGMKTVNFDPATLEEELIKACEGQGHFFEVERLSLLRIERLTSVIHNVPIKDPTPDDALREAVATFKRGITYSNLGALFFRQGHKQKALETCAKGLFDLAPDNTASTTDTAVCRMRIARAMVDVYRERDAEEFSRRAVSDYETSIGADRLETIAARDELAGVLSLVALHDKDTAKAEEAIAISNACVSSFLALQGPTGREAMRSAQMNRDLRHRLSALTGSARPEEIAPDLPTPIPTAPFISHSYADREAVADLLAALPRYVKPIIFEPINVPPTEAVSAKLLHGVLGSDGFIFIDSPGSNKSHWTAFERHVAACLGKVMFRFDHATHSFVKHEPKPTTRFVYPIFHTSDANEVQGLVEFLHGKRIRIAVEPVFATLDPPTRNQAIEQVGQEGGFFLVLLTSSLLGDKALLQNATNLARRYADKVLLCWLDPPPGMSFSADINELKRDEKAFRFSARRAGEALRVSERDDLMVRLFWRLGKLDEMEQQSPR